ncbi:MAG: hypothetical protein QXD03_05385 [Candidatus Anstonellales archaeon]
MSSNNVIDKKVVVIDLETIGGTIYDKFDDNLECNRNALLILTGNAPIWKYIKILDTLGDSFDAAGIFDRESMCILVTHSKVPELSKFDLIKYDVNVPNKTPT